MSRRSVSPSLPRAPSADRPFFVVGIGASAGGLQALLELFAHVPRDSNAAYVVVTHQHPAHQSLLPELLRKATPLPLEEVGEQARIVPNRVYVAPPRGNLALLDSTLHVMVPRERPPAPHPIDYFFRSLAQDRGDCAVGVVLSGTGSDGTLGLAAIKGEGGMTMAEDPRSASYSGMPESAIQSGSVDYVLPAAAMPRQLAAYSRGQSIEPIDAAAVRKEDKKILLLLRARTGHDFSHYKNSTVRRRIERRMTVHHLREPATYLRFLQDNPTEIDALYKDLLIGVTSFFRDPEAFEGLARVLGKSIAASPDDRLLRVWVPGCSSGEEAYSIAILLREQMEIAKKRVSVRIFATDVDTEAVDRARAGVYPAAIAADVGSERLQRFFVHEDGMFRVVKDLRDMVVFAPQNMLSDPPFTRLDLLSCRNVMIYMDASLQERLMELFHYALRPGGLLFLGSSESVGGHDELFGAMDKVAKIFARKAGATQQRPGHHDGVRPLGRRSYALAGPPARQVGLPALAATLLLQTYVPPAVLVNERGDVVYIHGSTGPYLEPSQGQPSFNAIHMARDGLKLYVESILRQASADFDLPVERLARLKDGRGMQQVRLRARKILEPEPLRGLVLLSFETAPLPAPRAKKRPGQKPRDDVATIEAELLDTRRSLEAMIDQLQASNEELQSANEELQSMNEELQSANEELEIAKEETQALNEELHTVNAELRGTVDDLSHANDDMTNLLNATEIATIFLDRELRVRRYTTQATRVFHLIPSDVGRPIADLMPKVKYDRIATDADAVLHTLAPREVDVESKERGWFLMRLLPYRTANDHVDGIVMTFVDITKLREARAVSEARAFADSIVQALRQPLVVVDQEMRVVSLNRAFRTSFPLAAESGDGKSLHDLGHGRWDVPALREMLEQVLRDNVDVDERTMELNLEGRGHTEMVVSARRLNPSHELPLLVLLAFDEAVVSSAAALTPELRA